MEKRFEIGEVWMSPRGYFYKVIDKEEHHTILRMGTHGKGRKIKRRSDNTKGWSLHVDRY